MLNEFRAGAGGFAAKFLLAILVLSFAVWGIGDMARRPTNTHVVATVGSTPITIEAYQSALRRETEALRHALGNQATPEIIKAFQPGQRALHTLIQQTLIKQESQALGIIPSDTDIGKRIRRNPSFQEDGKFNKARLEAALAKAHLSEKMYIEHLRQDLATSLIIGALSVSLPATETAIKTLYDAREERRGAAVYLLSEPLAGAPTTPKTGELEEYFTKHAGEFIAPESRTLSYVTVKPEEARDKVTVSEEALLSAYKDRIDEFKRPERRVVDQLLFANAEDAKKANDAILSGKSFDELVKTAPITNKGSISLGKIEQDRLPGAAADEVFALAAGGVSKPIPSAFGWHIFRVKNIEPPATAPLNDVRALLEKDVKQQLQEEAQTNYINKIEDALAGGATLSEVAKQFGLSLHSVGPVQKDGKSPNGATVKLPEFDKFLDTAFATSEKTESALIGGKGGVYYVVRVDSVTHERSRSLDEVRPAVTAAWQKEMRSLKLSEVAATIAQKFTEKNSRQAAIAQYHLSPFFTGALKRSSDKAGTTAIPPQLVSELFMLAPGDSTGLHPLPAGGYVLAVAGEPVATPPMDKASADEIRTSLEETMSKEIVEAYLNYLQKKYKVDINEKLLAAFNSQATEE
jgi:peptidyl-prolyl cis-trans isomerase D